MSSFSQSVPEFLGAQEFRATVEDDGLDGDYSMVGDYPEEPDYYVLLGLARNPPPTEAEIRSAYRNLTLSFHPDKQPPHLRHAAESQFRHIQEAYETLIDPKKRVVYDISGAAGVRQEWGQRGAMGIGGEAQRQDVGVKAMSPDQFRRWFLKTMKKRERKAVESLVSSKGGITLGINAASMVSVDEDEDVQFHIPSPQVSSYGVSYNFKTPMSLPQLWGTGENETETSGVETDSGEGVQEEESEHMEVTWNAGITGGLARPVRKVTVQYEDGTEGEEKFQMPPLLAAQNFQFGATVTPNFKNLVGTKGIWAKHPFSLLRDSHVSFNALLLPAPTLKATIARAFQPIPGTKPFQVSVTSIHMRSLEETAPSFEVQISREIAKRKIGVITWSSGVVNWPEFLLNWFPSLGMGAQSAIASANEQGQATVDFDDDDEESGDMEEDVRHLLKKKRHIDQSAESWQTMLQATPAGGAPYLDSEGYFPMPSMDQARAVRLEISSVLGTDMSLNWTIKGVRRVGEYTRVGLGIGIADKGIMMTVSWSRLGQTITLPINVCPANEATSGAAALTAIFPWLAYCAIEFGYIRPRDRKLRRQAAARRHRELEKLIPKKREESLQAIDLMTDQVQRRQAREEAQDGLVILKAEYGYIPPVTKKPKNGFAEPRVIDVTIPVAALVNRGQLVIPGKSIKFQILGFHDPAPLLSKRLKIWYRFQGRDHFVEAGDKEDIACPCVHTLYPHEI
ncbi:Heat shock protein DnaJ N-terminal [Penicillium expansum]|nr:Heat shock protein DnaJ N-terminal [Penicillium expansum]